MIKLIFTFFLSKSMAGTGIPLVDLMLFYTLERALFNRLVGQMAHNPNLAKKVLALWLVLEEIGYHDLTRMIHSFNNLTVEALFKEALSCLQCIEPGSVEPPDLDDTPVFVTLFDEPMNRRFFYYNREFLLRRFTHVMESVCGKIFGEKAAIELGETSFGPEVERVRVIGESSSSNCGNKVLIWKSKLNPNAREFVPGQSHDDTRTMFLTFSKGFPLSLDEIFYFFTSRWGDVIQNVVIEQPSGGQPPLYGRVIFKSAIIIPLVLNGQSKAKFIVGRKHLWARIYVPRRR